MADSAPPVPPRNDGPPVVKSLKELVASFSNKGSDKLPRVLVTEAQLLGFRLARAVLVLMAVFVAGLVIFLGLASPSVTDFGTPATDASMTLWQKASTDTFQRVTTLIDQIVVRTLLPVLTLLLGYVFGSHVRRDPPSENGDGG